MKTSHSPWQHSHNYLNLMDLLIIYQLMLSWLPHISTIALWFHPPSLSLYWISTFLSTTMCVYMQCLCSWPYSISFPSYAWEGSLDIHGARRPTRSMFKTLHYITFANVTFLDITSYLFSPTTTTRTFTNPTFGFPPLLYSSSCPIPLVLIEIPCESTTAFPLPTSPSNPSLRFLQSILGFL